MYKRQDRGYLSPYFITNAEKMLAELEDAYNARAAALAGQAMQARSWIRVLGIIQRQQVGKA